MGKGLMRMMCAAVACVCGRDRAKFPLGENRERVGRTYVFRGEERGRRLGEDAVRLRRSFGGVSTRVRVFNFDLHIGYGEGRV